MAEKLLHLTLTSLLTSFKLRLELIVDLLGLFPLLLVGRTIWTVLYVLSPLLICLARMVLIVGTVQNGGLALRQQLLVTLVVHLRVFFALLIVIRLKFGQVFPLGAADERGSKKEG